MLDQFKDQPVYIVHSTFGGAPGYGGRCSNGGALSSIGVSWVVLNSLITHNRAIGSAPTRPVPARAAAEAAAASTTTATGSR